MNRRNRLKSNYIYRLRREDDKRFYGSGSSLPRTGSIFDSDSEFNKAVKR